jgi:signal transduction histidine kinase
LLHHAITVILFGNSLREVGDIWLREEWKSGAGSVTHPLLFECDRQGRVIWMSRQARVVVGDAPLQGAMADYLRNGESFRVWPAFVMAESLLFAVQAEAQKELRESPLADDLLGRYFRLENAERMLAANMRRNRGGRGAPALRQLERERERLGRELHTGVGQLLAAIHLQLEVVATHLPDPAESVQQALQRIGWLSQEALQQVRGISRRLYPPEWQKLGIADALRQLWDVTGIPQRFAAGLRLEPLPREPGQEIKVLLYRAAQEALSNIARHSGATRVEMTLETLGDRVVLTLSDDGGGFAGAVEGKAPGLGLRSIRDAAAEVGAKFDVQTAPGSTTLRIWAPFESQ